MRGIKARLHYWELRMQDKVKEQTRNKRTNYIVSTPFGDMCVTAAAELYGIDSRTVFSRISSGWIR